MQEWISVEDELPGKLEDVLAITDFGAIVVATMVSERLWLTSWAGHPVGEITYWMPLPEPPKE